ncbi:hypothetical protein GCM10007036_13920 [Alsobacter metallidurans]|uniref:Transglycosylase SLT domain-containing protein n=1 Tax=Alsobacter metallidurans TaxID=340221 RepID=A0A917I654_9HYPH|nr:transglycosylase SLT domain-containing protein [Alsobacter metallidurans]GGH14536.1 hypothetical protein GCM10007036_13920 [Alsobacter metallidurans]
MSLAALASLTLAGCVTAADRAAYREQSRSSWSAMASDVAKPQGSAAIVTEEARKAGVPANLAVAVMRVESGGRCAARNHRAVGLMQTVPATARGEGVHGSLTDCRTGARAGVLYLRRAIAIHGPGCAGVSAYNHGVHAPSRCTGYGRRVLRLAQGR